MNKGYIAALLLVIAIIATDHHLKERREQKRIAREEALRRNLEYQQQQAEAVIREATKNDEALKEWGRQYAESLRAEREKQSRSVSE